MELDLIERAFMDNIVRKWFLKHLESQIFYRKLSNRTFKSILEIGCGRGDAIPIHEDLYSPEVHCAFDINPSLIERAFSSTTALIIGFGKRKAPTILDKTKPTTIMPITNRIQKSGINKKIIEQNNEPIIT